MIIDESIGEIFGFVLENISVTKVTRITKPCRPFNHINETAIKIAFRALRLAKMSAHKK